MKIEINIEHNFRRVHIDALKDAIVGYLEDKVNYKLPEHQFTVSIETDDFEDEGAYTLTLKP